MRDQDIMKQSIMASSDLLDKRATRFPEELGSMYGSAQRSASPIQDQLVSINIELDSLEKGFAHLEERLRIVLTPPSPENAAKDAEGKYASTPLQESLLAITSRLMYLRRVLNHISSRIDI